MSSERHLERDCWTIEDLRHELRRFEQELQAARLAPNSVHTYVNRSEVFIRWLAGDYHPKGPKK